MGAVSGWFSDPKIVLDKEYYRDDAEFMTLEEDEYESLIGAKKSFVVLIDQTGCTTADTLRDYAKHYMEDSDIVMYKMMFEDVKNSSLHEKVKYYPSVAFVANGKVITFLRADSDEDADYYNDYEKFSEWMERYLSKSDK